MNDFLTNIALHLLCFGFSYKEVEEGVLAIFDPKGECIIKSSDMYVDSDEGSVVVVVVDQPLRLKGTHKQIAQSLLRECYRDIGCAYKVMNNHKITYYGMDVIRVDDIGFEYSYIDQSVTGWPKGIYKDEHLELFIWLWGKFGPYVPRSALDLVMKGFKFGDITVRANKPDYAEYLSAVITSRHGVTMSLDYRRDEIFVNISNVIVKKFPIDTPLAEIERYVLVDKEFREAALSILLAL